MGDTILDNNDPFGTLSVTPGFSTLHTKGTEKLLVVIFVIDCSKTMSGERIGAVNAAMQELKFKLTEIKNDNSLDLKIAILSFASNAKWVLKLTPIEEVSLDTIQTRPGLTEYGAAFHELNKVLSKDSFMKHNGKIAPPAIMFLTDGEPEDNYQADLDELLRNGWFINASRSVVLLGDAINSSSARNAVSQLVDDVDNDIVTAEGSTDIIQKIKTRTMHTIAGNPMDNMTNKSNKAVKDSNNNDVVGKTQSDDPFNEDSSSTNNSLVGSTISNDDPFGKNIGDVDNPFGDSTNDDDPFGSPASTGDDPFGKNIGDIDNPFGDSPSTDDPFGGGDDPFGGLI